MPNKTKLPRPPESIDQIAPPKKAIGNSAAAQLTAPFINSSPKGVAGARSTPTGIPNRGKSKRSGGKGTIDLSRVGKSAIELGQRSKAWREGPGLVGRLID